MAKKKITSVKEAWCLLGQEFERLHNDNVPQYGAFHFGICHILYAHVFEVYHLHRFVRKNISFETIEKMRCQIGRYSDRDGYRFVGECGHDYLVRATLCYFMAEVS